MIHDTRLLIRAALVGILLVSGVTVITSSLEAGTADDQTINRIDEDSDSLGREVAPDRGGWTVITTQGADHQGYSAELIAINESGHVAYQNKTYGTYFDVDPVPDERRTVEYVAARDYETHTSNRIERVNLTTGETELLYEDTTPGVTASRWHDFERLNDTHYVVAGIEFDRVFIVDIASNELVWQWSANESFSAASGGPPDDWTHINDVEVLDDGRIMVSLRNQDQVIFLRRDGTLDEDWTLGEDGNHSVLYEQHNPDLITRARGGPAVLVAGSENDRIVEYQREDDRWVESWNWSDDRLNWPRDADRLPNGNTLITDSHGDRVFEVTPDGKISWSVDVGIPYEAERLGTGAESAGGPSAKRLSSRSASSGFDVASLVPAKIRHGTLWVVPGWMSFSDVAAFVVYVVALGALVALEVVPQVREWSAER